MVELNKKTCFINKCSDNLEAKQKKLISEKNICVLDCSEDDTYFYTFKNKCYNECPENSYLSNEMDKICSIKCPENNPFEKYEECYSECTAQELFTEICTINNKNINAKEFISNKISQDIINGSMDSLLLNILNENKEDLLIKDIKETYMITSSYNQINKDYNNEETSLNLKDCENKLKEYYLINNDKDLIIYKTDYYIEGIPIPIVEYEIFHPETKEKKIRYLFKQ